MVAGLTLISRRIAHGLGCDYVGVCDVNKEVTNQEEFVFLLYV